MVPLPEISLADQGFLNSIRDLLRAKPSTPTCPPVMPNKTPSTKAELKAALQEFSDLIEGGFVTLISSVNTGISPMELLQAIGLSSYPLENIPGLAPLYNELTYKLMGDMDEFKVKLDHLGQFFKTDRRIYTCQDQIVRRTDLLKIHLDGYVAMGYEDDRNQKDVEDLTRQLAEAKRRRDEHRVKMANLYKDMSVRQKELIALHKEATDRVSSFEKNREQLTECERSLIALEHSLANKRHRLRQLLSKM